MKYIQVSWENAEFQSDDLVWSLKSNISIKFLVRAAEGDGSPQAFPAFLHSKGGSAIQRAQPTKRHGAGYCKFKPVPTEVLCVNR